MVTLPFSLVAMSGRMRTCDELVLKSAPLTIVPEEHAERSFLQAATKIRLPESGVAISPEIYTSPAPVPLPTVRESTAMCGTRSRLPSCLGLTSTLVGQQVRAWLAV